MQILKFFCPVSLLLTFSGGLMAGPHTFVWDAKNSFISFDMNEVTVTGGQIDGVYKVTQSTSEILEEGSVLNKRCVFFIEEKPEGVDSIGRCEVKDSSGDEFYTVIRRTRGNLTDGGLGEMEILGGTGRYETFQTKCSYRETFFPEDPKRVEAVGSCGS